MLHSFAMLPLPDTGLFSFLHGVPTFVLLTAFIFLTIWTTIIKAFALWYAAKNNQPFWFVAMLVLNTLGVLELVYLLGFRKDTQVYKTPAVAPGASDR